MNDIIIVGGGLAGLINAILLSRKGFKVLLIEKKHYPFDKVCGEYVSNEVAPFLKSIHAYPEGNFPQINKFLLSSISGKNQTIPLKMGGFGVSRHTFDNFLYHAAKDSGANFLLNSQVQNIIYCKNHFKIDIKNGDVYEGRIVIGAYGKRSVVDRQLNRKFMNIRSPYIGVKYHINFDYPKDTVALHNFKGGYCGLVAIEEGKINLCYLSDRSNVQKYGNLKEMENKVLLNNPFLKDVFLNAKFISDKPEVINEISFAPKSAVEQHVLMSGDTAGLISPLCGNGMAMAIHSAKILSDLIYQYYSHRSFERDQLEKAYIATWNAFFARRLWVGRNTQKLFGNTFSSEMLVHIAKLFPFLMPWLIKQTHGQQF
jgi:menaquinone-9 beta-reductase